MNAERWRRFKVLSQAKRKKFLLWSHRLKNADEKPRKDFSLSLICCARVPQVIYHRHRNFFQFLFAFFSSKKKSKKICAPLKGKNFIKHICWRQFMTLKFGKLLPNLSKPERKKRRKEKKTSGNEYFMNSKDEVGKGGDVNNRFCVALTSAALVKLHHWQQRQRLVGAKERSGGNGNLLCNKFLPFLNWKFYAHCFVLLSVATRFCV